MGRKTGLVVAGVVVVVGWGEWVNWRWSRGLLGDRPEGVEAVVVLGYRNPGGTANLINRWRVRAGVRSVQGSGVGGDRVIFSGGAPGGGVAEARVMAEYARGVLGFEGSVVLEERSTTTWENIAQVIPLVEDADRIKIVSQPAHAFKARAYLWRQRPDLARRLVRADDYRFGEWMAAKPLMALYGMWKLRGLRTADRRGRWGDPGVGVGVRPRPGGGRGAWTRGWGRRPGGSAPAGS